MKRPASSLYNRLFRTFRGRLAMNYIAVEFSILVIAAGLIYWALSVQINQEVDQDLFRDAQLLTHKLETSKGQTWVFHLQDFATHYRGVVQLVNNEGAILFSVGEELVGKHKKDISLAIGNAFSGKTAEFVSTQSLLREDNLRVVVMPIQVRNKVIAVAILARTTRDIQKFFKL